MDSRLCRDISSFMDSEPLPTISAANVIVIKMKTVYLVRHGEAENNLQGIQFYNERSALLTEKGKDQSRSIAARLRNVKIQALIASTVPRAQQTADIISAVIGVKKQTSEVYVERKSPFSLEGTPWNDENTKVAHAKWHESLWISGKRCLDGENLEDIRTRSREALLDLESRTETRIVVVTHGFFMRTLLAQVLLGADFFPQNFKSFTDSLEVSNTGITILCFDEMSHRWSVRAWNDCEDI